MGISVVRVLLPILICVAVRVGSADVSAKDQKPTDEIGWVLFNFPPLIKFTDAANSIEKAVGPMAEIQRELIKVLPQFKHNFQVVTFPRARKIFESGQHYCTILLLKTEERQEYLHFGETIATTLPPGLVILRKNESLLKGNLHNSTVDLAKLLQTTNFHLGVVSGRSFAGEVDQSLTKAQKEVFRLVVNEAMGSLFKMVQSQRVDGVLAYYLELSEEQARNPAAREFGFYPVKQDQEILSLPVSCEKTPWGQQTLKSIARAVKDHAVREKLAALTKQTLMLEPPKSRTPTGEPLK